MKRLYGMLILLASTVLFGLQACNNDVTIAYSPTGLAVLSFTPTPTWSSTPTNQGGYTSTFTPTSTSTVMVSTLAGSQYGNGGTNGVGTAAAFWNPEGIAVDSSGNIYVADTGDSLIRKITTGAVVTTLAGGDSGQSNNGQGTAASFGLPCGIIVDSSGYVYVGDSDNNMIRKITPGGLVTTLAGSIYAGSANGTGTAASFSFPQQLAVDSSGNIYVADCGNNMIRKITPGGVVLTFAGNGSQGYDNGMPSLSSFNSPYGIVVDSSGNLYVADTRNNLIRKITSSGIVSTYAGSGLSGHYDGIGLTATFSGPKGIALDSSGNLFVADSGNSLIRVIHPNGSVSTLAGQAGVLGWTNGSGSTETFYGPACVAVDANENVYVADSVWGLIREIQGL